MTISYILGIPAAPNNPSDDQPNMQTNTNSINSWNLVDHFTFESIVAGNHQQVHFPQFSASNSVINGTAAQGSVLYTKAGIGDVDHAQGYFKNPIGDFLFTGIKALASCSSSGAVNGNQKMNVSSVTHTGTGIYTIVLDNNIVTGLNFIILCSAQQTAGGQSIIANYVITGTLTFQLQFLRVPGNVLADPANFTFAVIQI